MTARLPKRPPHPMTLMASSMPRRRMVPLTGAEEHALKALARLAQWYWSGQVPDGALVAARRAPDVWPPRGGTW
jgi:hypothetical protein